MAGDDNNPFALRPQQLQPLPDQKTANSLALIFREDGHRRQCGCRYQPARGSNPHPAEQDVTGDATLQLRHQRDKGVLISAQLVHQIGLVRTSKGCPVDGANPRAFIDAIEVFNPNADRAAGGE